jgi:hypothetical protein
MATRKPIKHEGVVIFLDVLGTKGIWKRTPEKTLKKWDIFNKGVDAVFRSRVRHPNSYVAKNFRLKINKISFSDTMIITATTRRRTNKREHLLIGIADILMSLMNSSFDMGIYIRGCISLGNFYIASHRMIIGPAIDEAAEYYTMAEWVGISAAPSAHYALNKIQEAIQETYHYIRYDIPLKHGVERNGWALNWPHFDIHSGDTQRHVLKLDQKLAKHNEISVSLKYRNTLDFYRYGLKKTKEWHKLQEKKDKRW